MSKGIIRVGWGGKVGATRKTLESNEIFRTEDCIFFLVFEPEVFLDSKIYSR